MGKQAVCHLSDYTEQITKVLISNSVSYSFKKTMVLQPWLFHSSFSGVFRFVLLLQAMGKYAESSVVKISGLSFGPSSASTSIGPIAKRYWSRMIQLCTGIKEIQLEVSFKLLPLTIQPKLLLLAWLLVLIELDTWMFFTCNNRCVSLFVN